MRFLQLSYGWSVVLGWLCAGLAVLYLPLAFLSAFSAEYHPFADGAYFANTRLIIAAAGAAGFFVLATLLTVFGHRLAAALRGILLLGGVAIFFAAFAVAHALNPDPRPYIKMKVGSQVFAVPRQYRPSCGELRGGLCGMICWSTGKAHYSGRCPKQDDMPRYVQFELSEADITSVFSPSMSLKGMSVRHEGDLILEIPKDVRRTQIGDGDIAVLMRPNQNYLTDRIYIDDTNRIVGFVQRRANGLWYRIFQKTDNGTLAFATASSTPPMPTSWDAHSAYARQFIAEWRCQEPTCGGRFME